MNDVNGAKKTPAAETVQGDPPGSGRTCDMELILDIPLNIRVELGQVKMQVNELLQLGQGSIVELNKAVGEPLEIFVNEKLIARGEAVVLDEKFGIRVTDIISPLERVKSLGGH